MGVMKDFDIRIRSGGDDAIAAVGELMPQWISVEERLPEDDRVVLASNGSDVSACFFKQYDKFFRHIDDYFHWKPTHWMPLPEPPEEKK